MSIKTPLTIKDGKFYRGYELVPLEFGNKEQIALMKKYNERIAELEGDGQEVEVEYEVRAYVNFECICGNRLEIDNTENLIEGSSVEEVSVMGDKCKCSKCQRKYKIAEDDFGSTVLRLYK